MLKEFSILIIDDHRDSATIIKEYLKNHFEVEITIVHNAFDAFGFIEKKNFDLIFSDIMMPEIDGFELAEKVCETETNKNTPVIFISAIDSAEFYKLKGFDSGAVDFIAKPINEHELVSLTKLYMRFIQHENKTNKNLRNEIEKRKKLEVALKNSNENFKNIVEKSDAGIIIIDQQGIVQFMNRKCEEIFQRDKKDLIGRSFGLIQDLRKKSEIEILKSNGELGVGEISSSKTQWKGKDASLILINDITKHVKLQENLKSAMLKAQESDNLKTAFLANMSHEIRTPLNGIIGFSQLLQDNDEIAQNEVRHYAKTIYNSGNYLLKIMNDILDIALIESKQIRIKKSAFNVNTMYNDIISLFMGHESLVNGAITFEYEAPPDNNLFIYNDDIRFKQVYINLLNNAFKFTDKGKVQTGFEINNKEIKFYVKDTGIGIDKKKFNKIFDRFEKTEIINQKLNAGMGLGLAISKELISLMGGRIWFESEKNIGTRFYFSLPVTAMDGEGGKEHGNLQAGLSLHERKRILIVEDEELNYLFIKSILKETEIELFWAKDGKKAVEIAKKTDIDIILMDMKLPLMDGYEATKLIRKIKPDIPIIAQTAYAMSNDRDKCIEAGCNDYLSKPIDKYQLISVISNYLN